MVGLACVTGALAANELLRRFGLSQLADLPESARNRPDVGQRYAALNEPLRWRPGFGSLVQDGWTLFLVGFFAVLGATDFGIRIQLLTAAFLAASWGIVDIAQRKRDEADFWSSTGLPTPHAATSERWRARVTYYALSGAIWAGWTFGAALVGGSIGKGLA